MLKLDVPTSDAHYFAIGHALGSTTKVDSFEVSDLTIDCNLAAGGSSTACGAVRVMGDEARIQRVKAVNWGTKSSSRPCFVFSVITGAPDVGVPEVVNAGMENCVAITPAGGNTGVVTAFNVGSQDDLSFTKESHAKSPFIRNCSVDFETPGQPFTPSVSSPKFRGLSMGWCRGGVVEGNHIHNADIGGAYQDKRSIRDLIVPNNFFKNVGKGTVLNLGQLGNTLVTSNANLTTSSGVSTVSGGGLNTATLELGDRVSITTTSPATFTGVYQIASVQGGGSPQFTIQTGLTGPATVTVVKKVLAVSRVIIEGNVIELLNASGVSAVSIADNNGSGAIAEVPDYLHGDIILRNNKIRYVDGIPPNDGGATLIEVEGSKNLMVQNNVLETIATLPLKNKRCGHATYFNNRTPAGKLLQGYENDLGIKYGELETDAEDAFVLALCNKH